MLLAREPAPQGEVVDLLSRDGEHASSLSVRKRAEATTAAGMIRMGPRSPDPMPVTAKVARAAAG